jgi:decaprenylphospho-beta-D-ribofuranose 2-oxidase
VRATACHQRPDRYRHLEISLGDKPRIARGGGLSYAAASFGAGIVVQEMTAFSRILAFDEASSQVSVEAGIRIGTLLEWASERGLCVAVVPGHPAITVGGCIAADVHGKNAWHVGTFRECTRSITLFRPDISFVTISRETGSDEFDATCGGFGLTGLIVSAVLQLIPLRASRLRVTTSRVESLEQAASALLESNAPFSYSWHAGGKNAAGAGAGLLFENRWNESPGASVIRHRPPDADRSGRKSEFRCRLWNSHTLAMASGAFRFVRGLHAPRSISVYDNWFPMKGHDWYYRLFGSAGFGEMQLLVPTTAIQQFCESFRRLVTAKGPTIAFLSMKAFRAESSALGLSGEGILFAVDYLPTAHRDDFESSMDELTLDAGAQPNLSKDSRVGRAIAARSLPRFDTFRNVLSEIDPIRRYQSALSQRLDL